MSDTADVRTLLDVIARHRVLPPPGVLPPDSEELRAILAEIAQGSRSIHAALIREVASSHGVAFEELVRRSGFVLACVALPPTGTHYELLGVPPTASSREIRQRWAALIQRYHPDHAGSEGGLGDQARRLIDAYQTLRDPGRRRRYDADLVRAPSDWQVVRPVEAPGSWRKLGPSARWKWAPAVIVAVGVIVVIARWTSHQPGAVPRPAPRPAPPVVSESPPTEQPEPPSLRPLRDPGQSVTRGEPNPEATPPAAATLLPSLSARLARLEPVGVAPTAEPAEAADQRMGLERRETARKETDGALAARVAPVPGSSLPSAEAAGRTSDRVGAEAASHPAAPDTRSAPPMSVDRAPPAPERVSSPKHDVVPPRRTIASLPPRAESAKPTPEASAALIESFRDAYERKDLDGLVKLLGADVREGHTIGRNAVQHLYARNFRTLDGIRYEVSQVTAQSSTRDGEIIVHGRFRIRAVNLENRSRPLDVSGPIRWVIRREGEVLRIVGIDYDTRGR